MEQPPHLAIPRHEKLRSFRGLIALAAPLPIMALLSMSPASWWTQSGFDSYPGTFVRISDDHYRLCRPWGAKGPEAARTARTQIASRFGVAVGQQQNNFALLLPANARITEIYCGVAPPSSPLKECTPQHCAVPARIQVEDLEYTRGRGITFSVRSQAPAGARAKLGFWVAWRPE